MCVCHRSLVVRRGQSSRFRFSFFFSFLADFSFFSRFSFFAFFSDDLAFFSAVEDVPFLPLPFFFGVAASPSTEVRSFASGVVPVPTSPYASPLFPSPFPIVSTAYPAPSTRVASPVFVSFKLPSMCSTSSCSLTAFTTNTTSEPTAMRCSPLSSALSQHPPGDASMGL